MENQPANNGEANPDFVAAWVTAWAFARGFAAPVPFPGGLRVDVGTEAERVRYVFFRPDAAMISQLAAAETRLNAFIKVCAAATEVAPHLPPAWRLHGPQHLMTAAIAPQPDRPLAAGYYAAATNRAPVLHAVIKDGSGRIVASGRLVLIGRYGIVDEINTEPDHRRRRLATRIVADLMQMGSLAGAKIGLLVATSDGHGLYAKMGWEVHCPYTSAYNI
jgi:GNAT superfamily N-acetyltransferase